MNDSRLSWEDPRTVLRRHNLWAKRAFSQNFLIARPVVERIAERAHGVDAGLVVELGPGLGTLTKALLATGSHVLAIERDRDMIQVLRDELGESETFRVRDQDAATLDLHALSLAEKTQLTVVGNLPYAITGSIFRNVVDAADVVPAAVFMVQREVRDRLQAEPSTKTYGALTVFTSASFDVTTLLHVGRNCFHPPPKITSSVVVLTRRAVPRAALTATFSRVVKAAFETRRKTLRNALINALSEDSGPIDDALASASIDGRRRGETLSVEEFGQLAQCLDAAIARDGNA